MQDENNPTDIPVIQLIGRSLRFSALFFCASVLVLFLVFWLKIPILSQILFFLTWITSGVGIIFFHWLGLPLLRADAAFVFIASLIWALALLPFRFAHLVFLHLYVDPLKNPCDDSLRE